MLSRRHWQWRRGLAVCLGAALLASASAADSRYRSWQSPAAGGQGELLKQLEALVREAEAAKAADPRFLRDLRALIRRHSNPWPVALVSDDFADGDYTANPAWTVASGRFRVLSGGGLWSGTGAPAAASGEKGGKVRAEDMAVQILGQLLLGGKKAQQAPSRQTAAGPAEIHLRRRIPNAFSISGTIAGKGAAGFEWGVYQGTGRNLGYRLIYTPHDGMVLMRISARGAVVIEAAKPKAPLLDGAEHGLVWSRDGAGEMIVSLDESVLLKAADGGFRDPFDGFHLFNRGGELVLYSLRIDGSR